MIGASQSPHTQTKLRINEVASAGLAFGRKICQKIRNGDAPSTSAASSNALGMVVKNWRKRKMWKGEAANPQSSQGQYELVRPMRAKTTNCGMMVTMAGTINSATTRLKSLL